MNLCKNFFPININNCQNMINEKFIFMSGKTSLENIIITVRIKYI